MRFGPAEILGTRRRIADFDPLQVRFLLGIFGYQPAPLLVNPSCSIPHHQSMVLYGESAPILQDLCPLGRDRARKRCVWNRGKQDAVELLNDATIGGMHASLGILSKSENRK